MAEGCVLYYITDRTAFASDESGRRRRLLDKIVEAASVGVDYVQLREKDLSTHELEALACEAVSLLKQLRIENRAPRTRLLINSRTDIALASGADGVHLRSDDISPQQVRRICEAYGAAVPARALRQALITGVSCHSSEEVTHAEADGANFAVFGPVFEKKTMPDVPAAGLTKLREVCKAQIPVLALGGVTLENAESCLEAGAAGIGGIRLFQESGMAETVAKLRSRTL